MDENIYNNVIQLYFLKEELLDDRIQNNSLHQASNYSVVIAEVVLSSNT